MVKIIFGFLIPRGIPLNFSTLKYNFHLLIKILVKNNTVNSFFFFYKCYFRQYCVAAAHFKFNIDYRIIILFGWQLFSLNIQIGKELIPEQLESDGNAGNNLRKKQDGELFTNSLCS